MAGIRISTVTFALTAMAITAGASGAIAVEPWASRELPIKDGLAVWLDGAAQAAGRQRRGDIVLRDGDPLEHWLDSSGRQRNLVQAVEAKRPRVRLDGELAMVRFDGRGSHLALDGLNSDLPAATLFMVAAPFRNEGGFSGMLSMHATDQPDFVSGMNIDQGPFLSEKFEVVNVEGAGFGGINNLLKSGGPFLQHRRLCVTNCRTRGGRAVDGW